MPGDDLAVIASGPTVGDASSYRDALAVLDRYRIDHPAAPEGVVMIPPERRFGHFGGDAGGLQQAGEPGLDDLLGGERAAQAARRSAAPGAGQRADEHADQHVEGDGHEADQHGHAGAVDEPGRVAGLVAQALDQ